MREECIAADALLTFEGETNTVAEWARRADSSVRSIGIRLENGWSIERALTELRHPHYANVAERREREEKHRARLRIPCPALTSDEAAQITGISKQIIVRAVNREELPRRYLGGALAFHRDELETWKKKRAVDRLNARIALLHKKERDLAQLRIDIAALRDEIAKEKENDGN
jgi:excisionase family DNA binding protein